MARGRRFAAWLSLGPGDLRLVAVLLLAAALAGLGPAAGRLLAGGPVSGPAVVQAFVVEAGGGTALRLDPHKDGLYSVAGPLGETLVEVRDGRARIASSPCPAPGWHGGWVDHPGERSVCLPNRVVLRAEGGGAPLDGETH